MFSLDYTNRQPIYEQLYQSITQMAATGVLKKGEPLPSVRSLAQQLGVNPNTVQKAYAMLERDGIIGSLPGKGSFISNDVTALKRQKKLIEERLREAVRSAVGCGITREEILEQVTAVFQEGGEPE